MQKVLGHPVFDNAASLEPLDIITTAGDDEDSGYQSVYDSRKSWAALKKTGKYTCAINMMWVNVNEAASNNIPIAWTTVEELQQYYFGKPAGLTQFPLEVAVTLQQLESHKMGDHGAWKSVPALVTLLTPSTDSSRIAAWLNHMKHTCAKDVRSQGHARNSADLALTSKRLSPNSQTLHIKAGSLLRIPAFTKPPTYHAVPRIMNSALPDSEHYDHVWRLSEHSNQ